MQAVPRGGSIGRPPAFGKEQGMTTDHQEIFRRVQEIVREQLAFGPEVPVPPDADFFAHLGGDSLDLAEVTMTIEDEFEINAPDGAIPPPVTPAKMAALVEQCLADRPAPAVSVGNIAV
jgi:acyl carrier protein